MKLILFLIMLLLACGHTSASGSEPTFNAKTDLDASIRRTKRGMEILDMVKAANLTVWEGIVRVAHFLSSLALSYFWTVLLTTTDPGVKYAQEEILAYKTFRFSWDYDQKTAGPVEPSCEAASSTVAQLKVSDQDYFTKLMVFADILTASGRTKIIPQIRKYISSTWKFRNWYCDLCPAQGMDVIANLRDMRAAADTAIGFFETFEAYM